MVTANNNSCLNALHLCLFCIATLYKDAATELLMELMMVMKMIKVQHEEGGSGSTLV